MDQELVGRSIELAAKTDAERQLLKELGQYRPVAITLDAQEIGALTATKTSPEGFIQYLLVKFKAAGVPVEGMLNLRLAQGCLVKAKQSVQGEGFFDYVWLPESYWRSIQAMGGLT